VDFEELETPGEMKLSNTCPTMLNLHKHKIIYCASEAVIAAIPNFLYLI
jgi:hypothetical protein